LSASVPSAKLRGQANQGKVARTPQASWPAGEKGNTMSNQTLTTVIKERDFEQVVLCRDPGSGLESVIAVHDTTLGPSLGGIRMRSYPTFGDAVDDALNLAQAMTYKAALAGLERGGGKSVINADPAAANRRDLLVAHARYIEALAGRYIPAVDMGTTVEDLELVGRHVTTVSSQRRDPSAMTARGVVAAIRAAVALHDDVTLTGARVAVQGLGHVGEHVARLLSEAGAQLLVTDVDAARVREACQRYGATPVLVDDIIGADVDVLVPCAAGGVIDADTAGTVKARYVIGAANNLLADDALAVTLAQRGIVHVPDFVANAGGLIACDAELHDDDSTLLTRVDGIGQTAAAVLERAAETGQDTVAVAVELATARLERSRAQRPWFASA
jgi:leucine dehydrogenase